jgi:phosphoadenosine phosphosulfate reductase
MAAVIAERNSLDVRYCNALLAPLPARQRIEWALENLPASHALTSSFGAQAAVALHLVTTSSPGIPVIFVDTGDLLPETYRFVDTLTARLGLNLRVFSSALSLAWQESRYGRRWLQGIDGLTAYNRDNKLEPIERALRQLSVGTCFAGLRHSRPARRIGAAIIDRTDGERFNVNPIADWSDRDIHQYLTQHDLPNHSLWEKGLIQATAAH